MAGGNDGSPFPQMDRSATGPATKGPHALRAAAALAFSWALLADLFFAPALILWLTPIGPERNPDG